MTFTVAIDGPAASGKGTIARAVAAEFGFRHLDTGLIYRAVGAKVAEGADPLEAAGNLSDADLARPDLRGEATGREASKVAALPKVREILLQYQRDFAKSPEGAVLDGRDIGTVVCPDAQVKLFVTASDAVRAERRWAEEGGDASGRTLEMVLSALRDRDERDRTRGTSPLVAAPDATVLDTSTMSVAEAIAEATAIIRARMQQT